MQIHEFVFSTNFNLKHRLHNLESQMNHHSYEYALKWIKEIKTKNDLSMEFLNGNYPI